MMFFWANTVNKSTAGGNEASSCSALLGMETVLAMTLDEPAARFRWHTLASKQHSQDHSADLMQTISCRFDHGLWRPWCHFLPVKAQQTCWLRTACLQTGQEEAVRLDQACPADIWSAVVMTPGPLASPLWGAGGGGGGRGGGREEEQRWILS